MEILIALLVGGAVVFGVIMIILFLINRSGTPPQKLPAKLAGAMGSRVKSRQELGFQFEQDSRMLDFQVFQSEKKQAEETILEWSMRLQLDLKPEFKGKTMICKGIFANLLGNVLDQSNHTKIQTSTGSSFLVYGEQVQWVNTLDISEKLSGELENLFVHFRAIHIKGNLMFAMGAVTEGFGAGQLQMCAKTLIDLGALIDEKIKTKPAKKT